MLLFIVFVANVALARTVLDFMWVWVLRYIGEL